MVLFCDLLIVSTVCYNKKKGKNILHCGGRNK
jgi:hypothetical protein